MTIDNIDNYIKDNGIEYIFLDVDGVILHSCQAIVDILNKKYNLNAKGEDVVNWNFTDIVPSLTDSEMEDLFTTAEFFHYVQPIKGSIEFMHRHKGHCCMITKCQHQNYFGKLKLFQFFELDDIPMIPIPLDLSKSIINMKQFGKSLFIDDSTSNLEECNADCKIQFREYNDNKNREWQSSWRGDVLYSWLTD